MPTLTLRPNGAGNYTNVPSQNPADGAHWDKVDEVVADGTTTMVYTSNNTTAYRDSYTLGDTAQSGTINSVTVHHETRVIEGTGHILPFLRLGGVDGDGTEVVTGSGGWLAGSETIGKPGGGGWSWANINSLEVGARLKGNAAAVCMLTQTYVVVDYSETTTSKNTRQSMNVHPGVLFQTLTGGKGY